MEFLIFLPILLSFLLVVLILPRWIKKCKKIGLLWEDMNKYNTPKNVASSGGVVVVLSFILGVLFYVALKTFIFKSNEIILEIFSLISIILVFAIAGLTDDLLGWKNEGLSIKLRLLLALFASIPLVVINAGVHIMNIPFLGAIDFGLFYPLLIIPLGIIGAATTYNCLAGFNGLEAGQGILILSFLSYVAYATGSAWLALVGLCMVACLVVFYFYNKFPAKVFPGDTLTYSIGALIAGMAILGNFEKIAVFVFIPYIIETFLKVRGKINLGPFPYSFGVPEKDGSLKMPYKKIYGITHLSIFILSKFKKKVYEKDVVYLIFIFQIIIILLAFFMI
jgi:UDP-N-acetylglucosamine--dolichyl-phosphate N-acetylglucosaminephosphotransferase